MIRKIACIFVILTMLFCTLSSALAVEKLATPTNLRWDGKTAMWDAVPNVSYYSLSLKFSRDGNTINHTYNTSSRVSSYDCTDAFKSVANSMGMTTGTLYVTFTVKAETNDYENYYSSAVSASSPQTTYTYELPTRETLATPVNLRWEGDVAVWDAVPNASYYSLSLKLSRDGNTINHTYNTSSRVSSYDCDAVFKSVGNSMGMTDGTLYAVFTVQAQTTDYDHYISGKVSEASPQHSYDLPVRERLGKPVNLRWDGTTAKWDAVPNAGGYSFRLKTDSWSYSASTKTNSFDCREEMIYIANRQEKLGEFFVFTFTVEPYAADIDHYIDGDTSDTSPSIYINPIAKDELPGDIDIDGVPGVSDARLVLQAIAKGNASEAIRQVADVDNNGKLDANDALKIMQYSAGWNVTLK